MNKKKFLYCLLSNFRKLALFKYLNSLEFETLPKLKKHKTEKLYKYLPKPKIKLYFI